MPSSYTAWITHLIGKGVACLVRQYFKCCMRWSQSTHLQFYNYEQRQELELGRARKEREKKKERRL